MPAHWHGLRAGSGEGLLEDFSLDLDDRRLAGSLKFYGVGNQVLEQLAHLCRIGVDRRERADGHCCLFLGDEFVEVGHDLADELIQGNAPEGIALAS